MRVDPIVTATFAITLAAPVVAYASVRRVRRGEHHVHRLVQAVLLVFCWMAVLALELKIRLSGGSGSLVETAPAHLQSWARGLLIIHIAVAVATYSAWTWLAVASWRRFQDRLPGAFSGRHRRAGLLVLGGLCITAASAAGMYALVFIA